ncbi:MAG TPA: SdpI family protein [Chitinophaga sp.]|uniref:SdpI family protein n=1 Tax=Chitinophaga sp. TaxID=1869181 RepID=UPI002F95B694
MTTLLHSTYCNASLLAGLLFLFMGYFIRRYPPKSLKTWYGYRSFYSTQNIETWRAANTYASHISRRIGILLFVFGIASALFFEKQTELFFYVTISPVVIGALYMVGYTEWMLGQEFDEEGNKRDPADAEQE